MYKKVRRTIRILRQRLFRDVTVSQKTCMNIDIKSPFIHLLHCKIQLNHKKLSSFLEFLKKNFVIE